MQPVPEFHYITPPEQQPEEQPDGRLTPFKPTAGSPAPWQPGEVQPQQLPPVAFPVAFNAFDWREFSLWQRAAYGNGSKGASSDRDVALQGQRKATGNRKVVGSYGNPLTPTQQFRANKLEAAKGYVAPLRMTTKTFSLGQSAVATSPAVTETAATLGDRL